jgi:hypothetical protein
LLRLLLQFYVGEWSSDPQLNPANPDNENCLTLNVTQRSE